MGCQWGNIKPFNEIDIRGDYGASKCPYLCGENFKLIEEEVQISDSENVVNLRNVREKVYIIDVALSYVPDKKLIEQGNHEQQLEKKGFYVELYNSRFALI